MDTESLKGKNVLILGASGQVGSNLHKLLISQSIEVTSVRKSKWLDGAAWRWIVGGIQRPSAKSCHAI